MTRDRIIVTSGNYDILTTEDIRFLQKCRSKGDWLIVGLHSDIIVHMSTNKLNNTYDDRQELLQSLKCVDEILRFNDSDGTSCNLLKSVKLFYPQADITFISKYDMHNMPETKIRGITFEVLN
jgi:cytidyltransferase-like protein